MQPITNFQVVISAFLRLALAGPWLLSTTTLAQEWELARDGASRYRIVIPTAASEKETEAAKELQAFIRQVSQAELPIINDDQPAAEHEIVLGMSRRLRGLKISAGTETLGEQGFTIQTVGNRLVITGGTDQGTCYGVYTFLEDYLGCRWLSSKVSQIPKRSHIMLDQILDTQKPALAYREVYYSDAMDARFAGRNKLNGNASLIQDGRLRREQHRGWGYWCHTFGTHVPAAKYFQSHPEYFALVDGRRRADKQLCLTHPEVFNLVVADLRQQMQKNPAAHYWSVSQNDTGGNCQCPACQAIDAREGTPMGSLLEFINRVAAEFPDKTISTLSYQYSRRPPKNLRPATNVLIMLCSIECDRRQPIALEPSSASFREDVVNWSKICNQVFVWDYVVQFSHLVSPFPNLRILQPDIQFFVNNHARGVFSQGNREAHGEWAELRAYLLAKLLWNPTCHVDRIINDFLKGFYGAAAGPLRQYIDLQHDVLAKSGAKLQIFGGPADQRQGYLSRELVQRYQQLFDEAEQRTQEDPECLARVQVARLPLFYVQLQLGYGSVDDRLRDAQRVFATAQRAGLLMFNEWNLPVERYRQQVMDQLQKEKAVSLTK